MAAAEAKWSINTIINAHLFGVIQSLVSMKSILWKNLRDHYSLLRLLPIEIGLQSNSILNGLYIQLSRVKETRDSETLRKEKDIEQLVCSWQ